MMNAMPNVAAFASTACLEYAVFKKAIYNACRVVVKRNTIPILDTVLIKAVRGGVLVTGTDLDLYTSTFVPGEVSKGFECLIDAHKLKATMDKVKDAGTINFSLGDDRLTASIGKLKLNLLQELQISDYPDDQAFRDKLKQSNCSFVLSSATLAKVLAKIEFAISTEETRYYLNGAFMHIHESRGKLTFVTTDGHRLGRYEIDIPAGAGALPQGVIIPQKTVTELLRLLKRKGCAADTLVAVTDTGISFRIGEDEHLESKLIDGTFPDYQRVLPAQNDKKVVAYVSDMIDAIKQASAVSAERGKAVKVTVSPGRVHFTCTDPEFGSASTDIKATTDAAIEIGFNAGYLVEILGQIGGAVELKMNEPGDPTIITDTSDHAVTYVQMPMRV
jgi:DNA polymerase-3 subunit beta